MASSSAASGRAVGAGGLGGGKLMQYDHLVKLLLIGDSGVGKSSLLCKFADGKFSTHITQTVGMDFKVKMLDLGGRRVKLQVWDTAGQERFHTITQQYYRNAMGIILVYDATNEESFANIRRWSAQIAAHGAEDTNRLLVGNKADYQPSQLVVETSRGQALADEYGIPFFETSAKSGLNVEEAFIAIADDVRKRLQSKEITTGPPQEPGAGNVDIRPKSLGARRERAGPCCGA
mmetsp:Transcript_65867/g.183526  ORF Transcript_65867/g.183526 Transcript_65867/m.183526 type:complete len:233 (-) Transcript_65867:118-816(-)